MAPLFLSLLFFLFTKSSFENPLNFTHRVLISFSVDGEPKGDVAVGLWRDDSPKAVDNFLALCMGHTPHKLKSGHKLNLKNKRVYKIQREEYLMTGDMSPNYNWEGNETIFSDEYGKYTREDTFYSIEPGVLMLEAKEGEYGKVGSEFKFYLKRYEYHFTATVFGQVYRNLDLLYYISKTAGDSDGEPRREVYITECKVNREDLGDDVDEEDYIPPFYAKAGSGSSAEETKETIERDEAIRRAAQEEKEQQEAERKQKESIPF